MTVSKAARDQEATAGFRTPLTTGITLRRGDDIFSFDFDQPGDHWESVHIVYRLLARARPDEDLGKWEIAEERAVLA